MIAKGANLFVSGRETGCGSATATARDHALRADQHFRIPPARLNCVGSTTIQELVRLRLRRQRCTPPAAVAVGSSRRLRDGGRTGFSLPPADDLSQPALRLPQPVSRKRPSDREHIMTGAVPSPTAATRQTEEAVVAAVCRAEGKLESKPSGSEPTRFGKKRAVPTAQS